MKKGLAGLFGILVVLFILAGCSEEHDPKKEAEAKEVVEQAKVQEEEDEAKAEAEAREAAAETETEMTETDTKVTIDSMVLILQDNFQSSASVEYQADNKVFVITPTEPGFVSELVAMIDGTKDKTDWNTLLTNITELSVTVGEILGPNEYSVIVTNPLDTSKALMMAMDGTVIYDAFQ